MKITVKILLGMLFLALNALVFSNFMLKKEFEKIDKSDFYWNYNKISNDHFSHIKIDGGDFSGIAVEQSDSFAVKVWKYIADYDNVAYQTKIVNDTLFIRMSANDKTPHVKRALRYTAIFRVFTPGLKSISGVDANIEFIRMRQPDIEMNMTGKSIVNYQTDLLQLDKMKINASDSTQVFIGTNPEIKADGIFYMNYLDAQITGNSSLQLGRSKIDSLNYTLSDTASIFLSGHTLGKIKK
jgi:hypothetical protein